MTSGAFMKPLHNHLIVAVLLAVLLIQGMGAAAYYSPTTDETAYIGGAYYHWKTGNFSMVREHPPLTRILAGAPLTLLNLNYPEGDWNNSQQAELGKQFLYESGNDLDTVLFFARLPTILLSVLLGFFLFLFAKTLYGYRAGVFALFLYVFESTVLGHSSLATTDLAPALFIFLSMFAFWHFVRNPRPRNALLFAAAFGLAQISKFTALYLIPITFVLALLFMHRKLLSLRNVALLGAATLVVSLLVINAAYLFQGTGKALTDSIRAERIEAHANGPLKPLILAVARTPLPLPEDYMIGFSSTVLHDLSGHSAFFLGQYSRTGWWYYFPVAFVLKVSVALLVFIMLAALAFRRHGFEKERSAEYIAIAFVLMFFGISLFSHINIGIRHMLPTFPFIFLLCSKAVKYAKDARLFFALAALYALSTLIIAPHYLSHFTEPIGSNGYQYLADSNNDWGQDLKGLAQYLERNNISDIRLTYFGTAPPEYYGIRYTNLTCEPAAGIVAISTNYLQHVFESNRSCFSWLALHTPAGKAGYSIFIYNITA